MAIENKNLVDSGFKPSDFVGVSDLAAESATREGLDTSLQNQINILKVSAAPAVKNENSAGAAVKLWSGTQAQYDAVASKDSSTIYFVLDN